MENEIMILIMVVTQQNLPNLLGIVLEVLGLFWIFYAVTIQFVSVLTRPRRVSSVASKNNDALHNVREKREKLNQNSIKTEMIQ